jgi:asparagine synthase (glutamine-hydrolysing)
MCGIAGYIGKRVLEDEIIYQTLNLMKKRGPDSQKFEYHQINNTNYYLFHSRLSIIDIDKRSNQPFSIEHYTIIFNGEIYNYIELRQLLDKKGIKCGTNSDTEVLLYYYILFGEDCVDYFEGMWSFAILNRKTGDIFLSRDRFAEKPLFVFDNSKEIIFASEIKLIKKLISDRLTINYNQVFRYLSNGYKSLYKKNETFFNEIAEVDFASNMIIDNQLKKIEKKYWNPEYKPLKIDIQEAIDGVRENLLKSVELRLRSDVPLAFCLSGGVDSAGLASIAAKEFNYDVNTYSIIDPDERYNEYDNMKATIDDIQCKAHFIHLEKEGNYNRLKTLVDYHDVPVATISYLIHSYISEAISKDGYKVAISGTGADEILTGYYDHFNLFLYEMRNHKEYKRFLKEWYEDTGKFVRNPYLKNPELYFKNPYLNDHIFLRSNEFSSFLRSTFYEEYDEVGYSDSRLRNRMMNEMFHEVTRVITHEDDLNSMLFSIENRSPYLDKKLFEFAYSIPNELLINDGYAKYVLRKALDGILNDQVRLDRRKKGFNASISSIIDFEDMEEYNKIFDDSPLWEIIEKSKVMDIVKEPSLTNSNSKFLFNLINVKLFLELND